MTTFDERYEQYLDEDWKSATASAMLGAGLMFGAGPESTEARERPSIEDVVYQPPANAPRGVRNNNPGNVEISNENWIGKINGTDPRFETFLTPEWGIRAIGRVLMTYYNRHDLNTIHDIIHRWAPEWRTLPDGTRIRENDTPRYIRNMERITGLSAHEPLNLTTNRENMKKVIIGIIRCENSFEYPDDVIENALEIIFMDTGRARDLFTQQQRNLNLRFAQR